MANQVNGSFWEGTKGWKSFNWLIIALVTMSISSQGETYGVCATPPHPGRLSLHPSPSVKYCWQNISNCTATSCHCWFMFDHTKHSSYLSQETSQGLAPNSKTRERKLVNNHSNFLSGPSKDSNGLVDCPTRWSLFDIWICRSSIFRHPDDQEI